MSSKSNLPAHPFVVPASAERQTSNSRHIEQQVDCGIARSESEMPRQEIQPAIYGKSDDDTRLRDIQSLLCEMLLELNAASNADRADRCADCAMRIASD